MSGHSKWATIKRKKGAIDAKRSRIFTRIVKEITVAVKEGGSPDPEFNPRLRLAVNNAKGVNMPKDNIERAIKKANEAGGENYQELSYEGYAPGGIALFIECSTDNINRTVANIRSYFNKSGGSLGTNGSVEFMFVRKGVFVFPLGNRNIDDLTLELIDAGADEVEVDEENVVTATCSVPDYGSMQKKLEEMGITATSVDLQRFPTTTTRLDMEAAKKVLKLIDTIEEDEDINAVFHNMELTEELMEELE